MKNTVVFRDNQELDAEDLNNIEAYARSSFDTLTNDAINTTPAYAGFTLTQSNSTTLAVAGGRFYDSTGAVWELTTPNNISLFSLLPLVTQKWIAIVVNGSDIQTNVEPRDFLIDATTNQTQPQSVAMEESRLAVLNTIAGVEAPQPSQPPTPTTVTIIGYVLLSTTGIQQIIQSTATQLPNLQAVEGQVGTLQTWQTAVGAQINSLSTSLSALAQQTKGLALASDLQALINKVSNQSTAIANLTAVVANLALQSSKTPVVYFTEVLNFIDFTGCDHTNGSFTAIINEGICFPAGGGAPTVGTLALLNSLDPLAAVTSNFCVPAFTNARYIVGSTAGLVAFAFSTLGFWTSVSYTQLTNRRRRYRCGVRYAPTPATIVAQANPYDPVAVNFAFNSESFSASTNGASTLTYNPATAQSNLGVWQTTRLTSFWSDHYSEPYWNRVTTSFTSTAYHVAQVFLQPQDGWLTQLGLYFTQIALTGSVQISVVNINATGTPDPTNAISTVTLTVGSLQGNAAGETLVTIPPVFLAGGQRYAVVINTGGSHALALTSFPGVMGGVFYTGSTTSGVWTPTSQELRMNLYSAQWAQTHYEIQMQPLSLSGGIEDIDFLHHAQVPDSCNLEFQVQMGGVWYPLATAGIGPNLSSLPTLLPLKAVFDGTTYAMPGFGLSTLSQTQLYGSLGTSYTFLTTTITPSTASQNFVVSATLVNWNPSLHTATIRVKDSGGTLHTGTVVDTLQVDGTYKRVVTYALGSTTATFVVQIDGSTSTAGTVFQVSSLSIDSH